MMVLVDGEVVRAMERGEVEVLGDREARKHRGTDVLGRRGGDVCVEGVGMLTDEWVAEAIPVAFWAEEGCRTSGVVGERPRGIGGGNPDGSDVSRERGVGEETEVLAQVHLLG